MANIKTLKPFQKGHDPRRNTKGRPKGRVSRLEHLLDKALEEEVSIGNQTVTNEIAIIMKLIDDARKGKLSACKLYFDYRFGKPTNHCPKCDSNVNVRLKKEVAEEREKLLELKKKADNIQTKAIDDWLNEWMFVAKK